MKDKVSKYDLDWQVARVSFKRLRSHTEKMLAAKQFLLRNRNSADKERVLNYLVGLSMAYRDEQREAILSLKKELESLTVANANKCTFNTDKYSHEELQSVVKDLMARNNKWLRKGYRHEDQNIFLKRLMNVIDDDKRRTKHNQLYKQSFNIENSHRFFF